MDRKYLMVIDSSIYEKVKSRESFDSLEERKGLHSLKSTKRRDMTPINQISDYNFNHDFKIDELNQKREKFSNDVYNFKRHQYKLKEIPKEGRKDRKRAEFG